MVTKKISDKGYLNSVWEVEKRQVSQTSADYEPFGAKGGKGCASCQWYIPRDDACVLVSGDISPTGFSKYYTETVVEPTAPLLVTLVDSKSVTAAGKSVEDEKEVQSGGILDKIGVNGAVKAIKSLFDFSDVDDPLAPFTVFRTKEGDLRFLVVYSNIFEDKTEEIFSTKAHQEYVDWLDAHPKAYPELQIWHCGPGSAIGKGDFAAFVDGFAIGGGVIYKEHESKAEALAAMDTGVSHGYLGIQGVEGPETYSLYRDFEWTLLPREKAANAWTDYSLGVKELPLTNEKKAYLKGLGYKDDQLVGIETGLAAFAKTLQDAGVSFKAQGDAAPAPSPTPPTPTPLPTPITTPAPAPNGGNGGGDSGNAPNPVPPTPPAGAVVEPVVSADVKALQDLVGSLAAQVSGLTAIVKGQQKGIDDQVADILTAAIDKPGGGAVFMASASKENLAAGMPTKGGPNSNPDFEWFMSEVVTPINGSTAAPANAGPALVPTAIPGVAN